jgi:prepilin peptidase CpaA
MDIALYIILASILPALLVMAAVWDLMSFTIPNVLPALLAVLFAAFALVMAAGHSFGWHEAGLHAAAGLLALTVGMLLFGFGWIGGGDAKLFAAAGLWIGWNGLFEYVLLASVLGGGLTLGLLALREMSLPAVLMRRDWVVNLTDKKSGVPYGIALSAAALFLLPQSAIFGGVLGK